MNRIEKRFFKIGKAFIKRNFIIELEKYEKSLSKPDDGTFLLDLFNTGLLINLKGEAAKKIQGKLLETLKKSIKNL